MSRIVTKIEYDGTNFQGWQLQPEERTVQGCFEDAVRKALGVQHRVPVRASGRTDAGVHAAGQIAHFDAEVARSPEVLVNALNHWLPNDVSVLDASPISSSFHAQYSASRKLYRYRIVRSAVPRPLRERFAHRVYVPIHPTPMEKCAEKILGMHDFASFTSAGSSVDSTVRRVYRSEWIECDDEMHYFVEANGFTYNMARALVGTMIEAGKGKMEPERMDDIILARDRCTAGPTASPTGLMLMRVDYDEPLPFDRT